ncbi:hypothetical protein SteCoe_4342 [Stentor coeruleus]|uniref:Dolichyl-diphosphooligosaccharide--protein glycosyltransferase 48 kDa subunit n=1 Tax=Stentor coeruleus TaxID=5963 RepID=A0A1R2CUW1_9CILI|nr:hypothetical protein SteCoe_4342 [Stentor coeruleus]
MELLLLSLTVLSVFTSAADILVLMDHTDIKESHSLFFDSIISRGHKIIYKLPDSQGLRLEKFDDYLYSTVILMCPGEGMIYLDLNGKVSVSDLVKFSDNGGNLVIFGDVDAASHYRKLANDFGVDFYEQGTRLYSEKKEKTIATTNITSPISILPTSKAPIKFSGIGLYYNQNSKLLTPLISTSKDQYVRNEFKKTDVKEPVVFAVAFQGRNNVRAVFVGSVDVCANSYMKDDSLSNNKMCVELLKWAFQEKSVLRYSGITHYKTESKKNKGYLEGEYTINDDLMFSIDIEELKDGKWQEYKTSKAYVEFVMLEPKIRKYLEFKNGSLVTHFRAPDIHGVYQFKVFLNNPGFSWIESATKVTVRPYKHNQFERFLPCAYPYYASVFASMSGFVVFSFYFLYHKNT